MTEFARNTKRHAKELAQGGKARILTQNGKAAVVIISVDAYQEMARDAEDYRLDLRLREALESYSGGERGSPAKAVIGKLRKRAQKRRSAS